jgi:uncharacterized protein YciI
LPAVRAPIAEQSAADWLMAAWKDGKLMVNGQTMDAAKASRDMQKILDAISKVEPSATTSAAEWC